jgi:hypothetical protein
MTTIILLALAGTVIGAVVGTLWYSNATPMGKIHMRYLGFDKLSAEEQKRKIAEAKPKMWKMYLGQMALTFLTALSARETSYEKSMWPGVSIKFRINSELEFPISNFQFPTSESKCGAYFILTGCIFIVMPRSRSNSIESNTWSRILLFSIVPVSSSILSARVDLPWSMCAIIEKFLMFFILLFYVVVEPLFSSGFHQG